MLVATVTKRGTSLVVACYGRTWRAMPDGYSVAFSPSSTYHIVLPDPDLCGLAASIGRRKDVAFSPDSRVAAILEDADEVGGRHLDDLGSTSLHPLGWNHDHLRAQTG